MVVPTDPGLDRLRRTLSERPAQIPRAARALARAVLGLPEDDMSHEECLAALPEYVSAEMEGIPLTPNLVKVRRHLAMCESCSDQYAELLEAAMAVETGEISVSESMPEPNLRFLSESPTPEAADGPSPAPLNPAEVLRKYIEETARRVLGVLSPKRVPTLQAITEPFFEQIGLLGGPFVLEPLSARAMGFEGGEADEALTILAATWVATNALVDSLSPEQVDALGAENQLCERIEEEARSSARAIHVEKSMVGKFAQQFARTVCEDPATLRTLLENLHQ